jgi:short subunit dehydrogenase-like uncharacterized protein
MTSRDLDMALLGATGFTGRLVAEYLDVHAPDGVRIALAGRNLEKLEALRASLGAKGRACAVVRADSHDIASLDALARRTSVVCTTVGPYAKYGMATVAACAKAGTHYADLTGEALFMRDSIDAWNGEAQRTGARVVHACGFDSIPSDVGVWLLAQALGPMRRATYVVEGLRGGFSGGTVASLIHAMEEASRDPARRQLMEDPYALSPDRSSEPDLGDERDQLGVRPDDFVGHWTAPFVMASVNTRVVRRTNALLSHAYGRQFRYREVSAVPKGLRGLPVAVALTGGLGALLAGLSFSPTRRLLARLLPQPGSGPSEETRRNGRMRIRVHGEAEDGRRAAVVIAGEGDPGYQLTALFLSQAALALALDQPRLPPRAGVLTPISALGDVLVDRLRAAGIRLTLEAPAQREALGPSRG